MMSLELLTSMGVDCDHLQDGPRKGDICPLSASCRAPRGLDGYQKSTICWFHGTYGAARLLQLRFFSRRISPEHGPSILVLNAHYCSSFIWKVTPHKWINNYAEDVWIFDTHSSKYWLDSTLANKGIYFADARTTKQYLHQTLFSFWMSWNLVLLSTDPSTLIIIVWRQFGKEYSSDDAGDGPFSSVGNIVFWATNYRYESPPPTQAYIQRMCRHLTYTDDITPDQWIHDFFYIAKTHLMRVRYARSLRRKAREREDIAQTWRYIFRHRSKPPSLKEQYECNMRSSFNVLWSKFGKEPSSSSNAIDANDVQTCLEEHHEAVKDVVKIVKECFKRKQPSNRFRYVNRIKQTKHLCKKRKRRYSSGKVRALPLCVIQIICVSVSLAWYTCW